MAGYVKRADVFLAHKSQGMYSGPTEVTINYE